MSDVLRNHLNKIRDLRNQVIEKKELTKSLIRLTGISDGILKMKINLLIDDYYGQQIQQLEPKLHLLEELTKEING